MKTPHSLFFALFIALLTGTAFSLPDLRSGHTLRKYTVRVMSYNIHHAAPPSKPGVIDLDAIAAVIHAQQPDLVALQEVDVFTGRSGPFNQAEELGKRTGMSAHFFKAIDHDGGEYGLAILSKLEVVETQRFPLPRMEGNGGEPRILATATIRLSPKEQFLFANTHLDAGRDPVHRMLQIRAIHSLLKDIDIPVIIAGDFNATPDSEVIRVLDSTFTRSCDPCEFTIPADNPNRVLDYVAYKPEKMIRVQQHTVIAEPYASDHLPVVTVLDIRF